MNRPWVAPAERGNISAVFRPNIDIDECQQGETMRLGEGLAPLRLPKVHWWWFAPLARKGLQLDHFVEHLAELGLESQH